MLGRLSASTLTSDLPVVKRADGLPATFIPGRNLVFFTFAAIVAYQRGLKHIVGGMCETDFSGYPDCRDDAIKALQAAINLGMGLAPAALASSTNLTWNRNGPSVRTSLAGKCSGPSHQASIP